MNQKEIKMVPFNGELIPGMKNENGEVYGPVKKLCESLGVDPSSQLNKLRKHPLFSKGMVIAPHLTPGGSQESAWLRASLIPPWLIGISPNRVAPDKREKLLLFQERFADVLSSAFVPAHMKSSARIATEAKTVAQTYLPAVQAEANQMDLMAQQHALLGSMIHSLQKHDIAIQKVAASVSDHEGRMAQVEAYTTGAQHHLTIIGAARKLGISMTDPEANVCGRRAAKICRANNLHIKKVPHGHYGEINQYPEEIALEVVAAWKVAKEQGH